MYQQCLSTIANLPSTIAGSYNGSDTSVNSNIYDRVQRVGQTINDLRISLAHEKELLNMEKIVAQQLQKPDSYPTNNAGNPQFSQNLPYEIALRNSLQGQGQHEPHMNYQNQAQPYPCQNQFTQKYYQPPQPAYNNMQGPQKYQPQNYHNYHEVENQCPQLGFENLLNIERDRVFRDLELSNSEKEILERERRNVLDRVAAYKQQLYDVERKCKIEKMQVEKNMHRLNRVSEQMLKKENGERRNRRNRSGTRR